MADLRDVIRIARRARPAALGACAVCHRQVTERDERLRLRGGDWAHRDCGTYRVRYLERQGVRPATRRALR